MAKGASVSSPDDLDALVSYWEGGLFHPVYIFAGTDVLLKEETVKRLQKYFLAGDDSGLNLDRFDGEAATAADVLNSVNTPALFGTRRLTIVRRAQDMPAAETNALADHLVQLPKSNCLVLLWDKKADLRHALIQSAKSVGMVTTFWIPFEEKLPRWIQERAQAGGKTISTEAARVLLDAVGPNTQDLAQELEKLSLYVKDRGEISLKDVESLESDTRKIPFLELDRAVWRKDRAKILSLLNLFQNQGERIDYVLVQLGRVYRKLFTVKALFAEKQLTPEEIWQKNRILSWKTQNEMRDAARDYSWEDLLKAFSLLLQAEHDLKEGRFQPIPHLTLLVCELTNEGKAG